MKCVTAFLLAVCSLSFLYFCTASPVLSYSLSKSESQKNANNPKKLLHSGMNFNCMFCKAVSSVLETILREDGPEEDVARFIAKICVLLKVEDLYVCNRVVEEFKEEVLTIAYIVGLGRPKQACALLLGPSCEPLYNPWHQEWNVTIPSGKPPVSPIPDPKVCLHLYIYLH